MKAVLVFACVLAVAYANPYAHAPIKVMAAPIIATSKLVNTGHSDQSRKQDASGNYAFSYNEQHHDGGSSRSEKGDAWGNKVGSYSLTDKDGRKRIVEYTASKEHGFQAKIKTNEPGTAYSNPANAPISSPYPMPVAPEPIAHAPISYAEPIAHAPISYAAPIAHAPISYGHGGDSYGHGFSDGGYGKGGDHGAFSYSTKVEHLGLAGGHGYSGNHY